VATPTPGERIVVLVVEDDPLISMSTADMIEEAGYEVVEAANADEAIRVLEARADISVVFTDVYMPGSMNGLRLAAFIRSRWPPIHLIVTSAYFDSQYGDLPERGEFFAKPYVYEEVIATIERLAG